MSTSSPPPPPNHRRTCSIDRPGRGYACVPGLPSFRLLIASLRIALLNLCPKVLPHVVYRPPFPQSPIPSRPVPSYSIISHPTSSQRIPFYSIPSRFVPSHLISSHPIPLHPIPSHPIPSQTSPHPILPSPAPQKVLPSSGRGPPAPYVYRHGDSLRGQEAGKEGICLWQRLGRRRWCRICRR